MNFCSGRVSSSEIPERLSPKMALRIVNKMWHDYFEESCTMGLSTTV